jgi:hypothetical protein
MPDSGARYVRGESKAQGDDAAPAKQSQPQQPAANEPRTPPAPQPSQPSPVAEQQQPNSTNYQTNCDQPKSREEDDLCQQRRMAKAAEDAVWWAGRQTILGIAGFAAVLLTLVFTGWAAVAASRAARAAQKSADSIPHIERAYVFFWDVERRDFSFQARDRTIVIPTSGQNVIYRNCGKTPAIVVKTKLGCDVFAQPPDPTTATEKTLPSGAVIGASDDWRRGKVDVSKEKIEQAKSEGTAIYLYGEITYRDIFKNEQRTWFCRRWTGDQFVLGDLTDEKLNGYT